MPVYVQPSDVTNVAPEFTSVQPSRINDFIEYARLFICEDKYGAKAKLAIIYQTAHLLKLSKIASVSLDAGWRFSRRTIRDRVRDGNTNAPRPRLLWQLGPNYGTVANLSQAQPFEIF